MGSILASQHQIRVYAEDVDFMNIVYHANHLCFFERARTELLRLNNLMLGDLAKLDVLLAITEININYRAPAKLDDLLRITTEVTDVKACSFIFEQKMHNENDKLISEARVQVVCVDSQLKPKRLPQQLRPI